MNTKVEKVENKENKKDALELFLDFMFKNKVIKKFFKLVKKSNYDKITSINLKDDKIVLKTEDDKCLIVYQDKSIKEVTDDFTNSEFERDPDKFITITKDLNVYLSVIKLSDYDNYFESSEFENKDIIDDTYNDIDDIINDTYDELKPFYKNFAKLIKKLNLNEVEAYVYYPSLFEDSYLVAKNKKLRILLENGEIYS